MFLVSAAAFAHGGGLDSSGCHTKRSTGDYHCHRSQAPQNSNSNAAGSTQKQGFAATPDKAKGNSGSAPGRPTCYTGPRGGTYTITPSGRKNYSGC